jgi:hypothetical protein
MDQPTATLIASMIPAAVSVVILLGSIRIARLNLRHGEAKEFAKLALEFKIRQLNELYSPLRHLLRQNKVLAQEIRVGKVDPASWRLMDHLPDILGHARDGQIAKAIVELDSQILEIINTKGGLVRGGIPPESFILFGSHYRLLKLAMEGMKPTSTESGYYFPRTLDDDVIRDYTATSLEVHTMMDKYERRLKEL